MKSPNSKWVIDLSSLLKVLDPVHDRLELYPSPDGAYLIVVYGIDEVNMGLELGNIAIIEEGISSKVVANPSMYCLVVTDSIQWLTDSFLVVKAYYYDNMLSKEHTPILLIDLHETTYTLIDFEFNVPYTYKLSGNQITLHQHGSNLHYPSYDGESYALGECSWYPLSDIEKYRELFFEKN